MIIKSSADRSQDIALLQSLLAHPEADASRRERIEQEIRFIRAGLKGEAEAAYEINFALKDSDKWAVLHDLRIEHQGRVAQIDHLMVNRLMDVWVCESKHFSEGVAINEHGEFSAFYGNRPYGVPSPLEQNRRHIFVLEKLMGSSVCPLPSRLGIPIRPNFISVVLVSKNARISRPKVKVDGIEQIMKNDQLRTALDRRAESTSTVSALMAATKIIGADTMENFARQLAGLHRHIQIDWHAKFGLSLMPTVSPPLPIQQAQPLAQVELLSTSKLAGKHGVKTAGEMLQKLCAKGYLEPTTEGHQLTVTGRQAGGIHVEKSRYGPYFQWPADLPI